ncbi:MAG: CPBP family intramembrane metalloprotease [Propionibacteriaceae bacterium]|jgi:membrane protease YdiL (CAAX protease family)|nr:CPBP family intramembrane metalloprotease [Propionibacteriaceae bacterium]
MGPTQGSFAEARAAAPGRSWLREIWVFFRSFFLLRVAFMYLALYAAVQFVYSGGLLAFFKLMGTDFGAAFEAMSHVLITPVGNLLFQVAAGLTIPFYLRRCLRKESMTLDMLGLHKRRLAANAAVGYASGAAIITAVALVWIAAGVAQPAASAATDWVFVGLFWVAFLAQGLSEELAFRAYFLTALARGHKLVPAVIVSSVAFALLHVLGGTVSLLTFANLTLFGVFASIVFIRHHNLWFLGALHGAWNFCENNVFGFTLDSAATGNASVFTYALNSDANSLIAGGAYGLEGSVIVTGILLLAIAVLLATSRRGATRT